MPRGPEGGAGVVQHLRHRLRRGDGKPLREDAAALFQGQGVDGDVVRAVGQTGVQGPAEALRGVRRQSRDQVHVHMGKAVPRRQLHGPVNVPGGVVPADGPEDAVVHGLGIDGHPGDAPGLQNRQLLRN